MPKFDAPRIAVAVTVAAVAACLSVTTLGAAEVGHHGGGSSKHANSSLRRASSGNRATKTASSSKRNSNASSRTVSHTNKTRSSSKAASRDHNRSRSLTNREAAPTTDSSEVQPDANVQVELPSHDGENDDENANAVDNDESNILLGRGSENDNGPDAGPPL